MLLCKPKATKLWLFITTSGKKVTISDVPSGDTMEYELYVSPDKGTVKLIAWSEKSLSILTILKNGINYDNKATLPVDTYMDKGRGFDSIVDILDGMLQVQLSDESYILLFLEGRKNQFPYLAQKIYSPLSATERDQYGLGKK